MLGLGRLRLLRQRRAHLPPRPATTQCEPSPRSSNRPPKSGGAARRRRAGPPCEQPPARGRRAPAPVRRAPRQRLFIHPVPVEREPKSVPGLTADDAVMDARVRTDPAYFKARGAMRQALGIVWRTPTPLFKEIEARIQRGEDLAGLVTQMREQPERFGDLRGQEEARSLLARLMPESAAVAAGRAERGAARADAAFAAAQVERAASAWRNALV